MCNAFFAGCVALPFVAFRCQGESQADGLFHFTEHKLSVCLGYLLGF